MYLLCNYLLTHLIGLIQCDELKYKLSVAFSVTSKKLFSLLCGIADGFHFRVGVMLATLRSWRFRLWPLFQVCKPIRRKYNPGDSGCGHCFRYADQSEENTPNSTRAIGLPHFVCLRFHDALWRTSVQAP